jgi:predicted transcriptional regulator
MAESESVTITLPEEVRDGLRELEGKTNRSATALITDAIAEFVARELETVAAIEEGLTDVRDGRVHAHEQVMAETRALIERYRTGGAA